MPPIPNKFKAEPRKYRYGVDRFICPVCKAVHWYDAKRCQGCNRSGPLPLVSPREYAKMRGTSDRLFDGPDEDDDDDEDE